MEVLISKTMAELERENLIEKINTSRENQNCKKNWKSKLKLKRQIKSEGQIWNLRRKLKMKEEV